MAAEAHLSRHDPVMAQLIECHGSFIIELKTDLYYALVSAIIGQQLSVKAAAAIRNRFLGLFAGHTPAPAEIIELDSETLRSIGFSRAKVGYIKSLAQHILDGSLEINKLPELDNEKIIKELVAVKGIGEWTAHMFLIFALGRLDVLPTGDLGVRMAVKNLYGFADMPTPTEVTEVSQQNHWAPYESVAAWYLWRSLDNNPEETPLD